MDILDTDIHSVKRVLAEGKAKIAGEKYIKIWGTKKREHPELIEVTAQDQVDAFGKNTWDYSFDFRWVLCNGDCIKVWTPSVGISYK